ncbi:MAG: ACP S-malonyltransferase [Pseudomonadota bacterium]
MAKSKAVVICPGRGTYNKSELGYLHRFHGDRRALIERFDRQRTELGQPTLSELDAASAYSSAVHGRGDNASGLIFACSYADYLAIDRDRFDIVAVTGNSMGWYSALACGGALDGDHGFELVNAMGTLMHRDGVGGQIVHTLLDEDWRPIPGRRESFMALVDAIPDLHISIELGGMIVFAGSDEALEALGEQLPVGPGGFPMRLQNHAAFHSPLLNAISDQARRTLPLEWFGSPTVPLIDGRGHIWRPHASDPEALWTYTLGHQISRTYDFTGAIRVAMREFAPDCLIVLGPGETLGGAVIQSLLAIEWRGWISKSTYMAAQGDTPFVLSCGRGDQRGRVI